MPITPPASPGALDFGALCRPARAGRRHRGHAATNRALFPSSILILAVTFGALCSGCATAPSGAGQAGELPDRAAMAPAASIATPLPAGPGPNAPSAAFPSMEANRPGFFSRLGAAAKDALVDPETWLPAAGAALIGVAGLDQSISDWASETAPVFGSRLGAVRASDDLLQLSEYFLIGTTLARTYSPDPLLWATRGGQSALMVTGITGAARTLTAGLKSATDRERPDASDFRSFPSGHTSNAASRATLARRDIDRMQLPTAPRWILKAGATGLAAGVAWARVEGRKHYASDVLAGWAVGHFVGSVLSDTWLGPVRKRGVDLSFGPGTEGGYGVRVGLKF